MAQVGRPVYTGLRYAAGITQPRRDNKKSPQDNLVHIR